MKILKYTFRIPKLEVIDDELVESGFNEETYTFTLLHKGVGLFEEMAHKPLMAYMFEIGDVTDKDSVSKVVDEGPWNIGSMSFLMRKGQMTISHLNYTEFSMFPPLTMEIPFIHP